MTSPKLLWISGANVAICNALGLDPNSVGELTINMVAGQYPEITVRLLINTREALELSNVLKTYELREKE